MWPFCKILSVYTDAKLISFFISPRALSSKLLMSSGNQKGGLAGLFGERAASSDSNPVVLKLNDFPGDAGLLIQV